MYPKLIASLSTPISLNFTSEIRTREVELRDRLARCGALHSTALCVITLSHHQITWLHPQSQPQRRTAVPWWWHAQAAVSWWWHAGWCDERLRGGLGAEAKESPSLSPALTSWSQIRFARMPLAVTACLKAPQTQTDLWKRLSIASVFLLVLMLPATIRLWGYTLFKVSLLQCNYTFKCRVILIN